MSNSKLVSYTKISPNRTKSRKYPITRISIHCVVGQCSIETLGDIFAPESREASSNYGIGKDGRVGMYVEECDRSWCTSNADNDHRAVTIETASDTTHPYAVNNAAYATLLDLCTDICERNGKKKLLWFADKEKTLAYKPADDEMILTVHRWFDNKSCPGEYLYSRHGEIAAEVTRRLSSAEKEPNTEKPDGVLYRVQVGAFRNKENAEAQLAKIKAAGFDAFITTNGNTAGSETTAKKTVEEIAKEVIQGKWGNGEERKEKLTAAGYDFSEVQDVVNELMGY